MKKKISDLEMKILGRLWELDSRGTVQQVINCWKDAIKPGYTTILKKLQVMEGKALVGHEKIGKSYTYLPLVSREAVTRGHFSELINHVFSNNRLDFAHAFLDDKDLSIEELNEIRKILDEKTREKINE